MPSPKLPPKSDITREGIRAGLRIKLFRMRTGIDATEMADKLGISRGTLYRYEIGVVVKLAAFHRAADLLGIGFGELVAPLSPAEASEFQRLSLGAAAAEVMPAAEAAE